MSIDLLNIKPRVLIVDNNERIRHMYEKLVSHWGFAPVVANGQGAPLIANATELVQATRCQLALVDMRLLDDLDDEDTSGIDLIPKLKPAVSIIVSASGSVENAQEGHDMGAVAFLSKEQGPEALKTVLESHARKQSANFKKLQIEPVDILEQVSGTLCAEIPPEYHDQILDIFVSLFPDARSIQLEKLGYDPQTAQISSAPRPKSIVLKVREDGEPHPKIVKLARTYKIEREAKKYEQYIDGHIRGGHNPVLLSQSLLWDIGGAKFNYVGTSETSFANLLHIESLENIQTSLTRFFTYFWFEHYHQKKIIEDISLYKLYCHVWGPEWIERAQKMSLTDFDGNTVRESRLNFQPLNPITWLFEKIVDNKEHDASFLTKTYSAVTHGDLHGDNLLVDQDHNAWVIDFERSGKGHILQDFIELESDIINRLKCNEENFESFFRLCLAVASSTRIDTIPQDHTLGHPEFEKALAVISILRSLAVQCTGLTDAREYILGLLFNTIFRATITQSDHADCRKRALMLAGILCHRLNQWDGDWPPPNWQQLL